MPPTTTADPADRASTHKVLYRIPEVMLLLSMSRTVIYQEMRAGRLHYVRQGTHRRITADAIADYIALLKREAREQAA